jgi:glycosyltransferase involved in cell wall biosynthesis
MASGPRVTVGMPVLNGGALFERALTSILAQSYLDIEILISDNASSDETADICRKFAAHDERIRYIRQKVTIPCLQHYQFLVEHARGEYFFWAPHDDWWGENFIGAAVAALDSNPRASACMGEVQYVDKQGDELYRHFPPYNLDFNDRVGRVLAYLRNKPTDNLYYAVFRRSVLNGAPFINSTCPEKGVIMHTLLSGPIVDAPSMLYFNQLSFKSEQEIADVFNLPAYDFKHQFAVLKVVTSLLRRGLTSWQFARVFPVYFFSNHWHKFLVKAALRKLSKPFNPTRSSKENR